MSRPFSAGCPAGSAVILGTRQRCTSRMRYAAPQLAERKDVYFATALIDLEERKRQAAIENKGQVDIKAIRGTSATARALFGLWADVDVGGPVHGKAHKNTKLPPTHEDALALV